MACSLRRLLLWHGRRRVKSFMCLERKDIVTQGEREGSIDIYTLPCVNIDGERLMCNSGDPAWG